MRPEPSVHTSLFYRPWRVCGERPRIVLYLGDGLSTHTPLTAGQAALQQNELSDAARLFQQARQLAPNDAEAAAGLRVVASLQSGKLTRKDLLQEFARPNRKVVRVNKGGSIVRLVAEWQNGLRASKPTPCPHLRRRPFCHAGRKVWQNAPYRSRLAIRSFGEDERGEVFVLTYSTTGRGIFWFVHGSDKPR